MSARHSPKTISFIMTAWRNGTSYGQVGEFLGLTKNTVTGIVARNRNIGEARAKVFKPATGTKCKLKRRTVVTFDEDQFAEIRQRAVKLRTSFAEQVRLLCEHGLEA